MRWHLVAPDGTIACSIEAEHKAEARFRLAPIPARHSVVSAAEFEVGWAIPAAPAVPKRVGRGDWYGNSRDAATDARIRQKLSDAVHKGMRSLREEHPEREQARRDKIAAYQRHKAAYERRRRNIEGRILRGIARRKANQQATQ